MRCHTYYGEIKRFLRDDGPIKVSRSIKELNIKIKEAQRQYLTETGEEIGINKLSEILKVSKEEIVIAMESENSIESIDAQIGDDENSSSKIEIINCNKDEENNLINTLALKQLIKNLDVRQREIVVLRYFKNKTQCQVAKMLGITQVQVSRIEKKILTNMRSKLIG